MMVLFLTVVGWPIRHRIIVKVSRRLLRTVVVPYEAAGLVLDHSL